MKIREYTVSYEWNDIFNTYKSSSIVGILTHG